MSTFADGYSRYLTNYFNYINKSTTFRKYFRNSIISITDPKFMSKQLIANKDSFPKYPYFLNAFARTDAINLVKIYNSSMDNTSNLIETMLGSAEVAKKSTYDLIPVSLDNFLAELNFQFSYISTPTDLYNYDMSIKSFVTEYQYRNFFSDLYTPLFHSTTQQVGETAGLEDKSFQYEYILYCLLYNTVGISHNIYPRLLSYLTYINQFGAAEDKVDQQSVLDGFQIFVSDYDDCISTDLASIIGKSMYDFQNISQALLQDLATVISDKVEDVSTGLSKSFSNFFSPIISLEPLNFLASNVVQQLNALVAADCVTQIYNDDNVINQNATSDRMLEEDDLYSTYMEKISESQLKNYLFLCFLYKFWPIKFLNVLQLSIKEYVEALIKSTNDNALTQDDYSYMFKYLTDNNINYENLSDFLISYIVPEPTIVTYDDGISAGFIFTTGDTFIQCANIKSFNAVNVHDYIFASGDNITFSAHVMSKDEGSLILAIESEYTGTGTGDPGSIPEPSPSQFSLIKTSGSINLNYTEVSYSYVSGGADFNALVSNNNVDDGDNTGWKFTPGIIYVSAYRYAFSPSNYLYESSANNQVAEFACINYYLYIIEEFFKSTNYNTFVEELTELIFVYLRDNGHVDYTFDWYQYHDVIDVYFKVFIRWKLLDQSKRCTLSDHTNGRYFFTNGSSIVYCANKEAYDLITDGDFIFSENDTIDKALAVTSHVIVGINYVLNLVSNYTGTTTSDSTYNVAYYFQAADVTLFNNVTLNFANKLYPGAMTNSTTDPSYDINVNIQNAADLSSFFNTLSSSQSFIRSMYQFSENLMLSTLTRETIYSVLSEFV